MLHRVIVCSCGITLLLARLPPARAAGDKTEVPKEVRDLVGTYVGDWTIYGIDAKGAVVKRFAWSDTLKVGNPQVKDNRAFITWTDEKVFEDGKIPPNRVEGREGYVLKRDGSLGDYFIEAHGQTSRLVKLADNVWTYTAPASPQELVGLGFPKGASGQHVLVKVITKEQSVEAHRISRLTTVSWRDADGNDRGVQYVSLQGHHKRKK
jgi:hypothetical protein